VRPAQRALAAALPRSTVDRRLRMVPATVVAAPVTGGGIAPFSDPLTGSGSLGSPWVESGPAWARGSSGATQAAYANAESYAWCGVVGTSDTFTAQVTLGQWTAPAAAGIRLGTGVPGGTFELLALTTPVNGVTESIYLAGEATIVNQAPATGDVLRIEIGTAAAVLYKVNGVTVASSVYDGVDGPSHIAYGATIEVLPYSDPAVSPHTPMPTLKDFALDYGATTSTTTDVYVDLGDGVAVPCPRLANSSDLAVGDVVLVLRQHHSLVIVDRITALGGTA
jgi:hypothetical protein